MYCVGREGLAQSVLDVVGRFGTNGSTIDPLAWDAAPYSPTPTIVEATGRLWAGHTVRELSHAYADNLTATVDALARSISRSREQQLRHICFVTGVPGSGKTLAGLSAVHDPLVHGSYGQRSAERHVR